MHHSHLTSCHSTQEVIKSLLLKNPEENYLVSTEKQTKGRGRRNKSWSHYPGSLAFSFNLKAAPIWTLTSLEVGVLIQKFFLKNYKLELFLKWPNDLIYQDRKVGGILLEKISGQLICGVGINLIEYEKSESFPFKAGFLFSKNEKCPSIENLSKEITEFIHHHRFKSEELIKKEWNQHCFHRNENVRIVDEESTTGKFLGINSWGAALIETDCGLKEFYTGSLFLERLTD